MAQKRENVRNWLDRFDFYSRDVNQFNLEGRSKVHSILGVSVTILAWVLVLVCLLVKGIEVATGSNPTVSVIFKDGVHLKEEEALDLDTDSHF